MFFEGGKENDLQAGVESNNMCPTFWPRDSEVVREEKPCPQGESAFNHSRMVRKTSRPEVEENEIFLMTSCGFQKAQGEPSRGRGENRVREDNVHSCMGIKAQ